MATWIDTPQLLDPKLVKARGYTGAMRYICSDWNTGPGTSMPNKRISRPELDAYIAEGVDAGVNFEDAADDYLGGYARGKAKGQKAGSWMLNELDWPAGGSCCSSIDADIGVAWGDDPGQEYQHGFADGLTSEGPYIPGIYGSAVALNGAAADDTAHVFWLTAAGYWSHDQTPKTVHLVQTTYWPYGSDADLNYTGTQPMGSYLQATGDADMPLTDADAQTLLSALITPGGSLRQYLIDAKNAAVSANNRAGGNGTKLDALKTAVAKIPTEPVDQAALERAVVAAVAAALAGGVPAGTVKAEVQAALAEATIPVVLAGHAGVEPVVP